MKKALRIFVLGFIGLAVALLIIGISLFVLSYNEYCEISFNTETLNSAGLNVQIYDIENRRIKEFNHFTSKYVPLTTLPEYVKEAFISIEDKTFYSHNGINIKRIIKAGIENIKSWNLKQGASTISQQLIKNTHLSGDKTFSRKIKEILLTQKLEREYSKDEIFEKYLNIIYFGNNCYGIESAANYYFSKPAKELTIEEGAMLAGIIKSPKHFSPVLAEKKCLTRRNLVISEMEKDGKLNPTAAIKAKETKIQLKLDHSGDNKLNSYSEAALDEAIAILKLPAKQIALGGYKIYTYQDPKKQAVLNSELNSERFDGNNFAGILIDPHTHSVSAYIGGSDYKILESKRQPGSAIKPVLVYAPAVNENIVSPATQILDEKIEINGYSPSNAGGGFAGYVSVRNALAKSINIPAIKTLSYVGIDRAKAYAKRMGIEFAENDDNYAIALGGMTDGVNLLSLTNAYTTFVRGGSFAPAGFISYIQNNSGKIVYRHSPTEMSVIRPDTAYLITDMLKTSAKSGTAKKLSDLGFEVASKTGTVGKPGSRENLDAYSISYTTKDVLGIWTGNMDNNGITIAGGNSPTAAARSILKGIYTQAPDAFTPSSGIQEIEIDALELEKNHRVVKATEFIPERYKVKEIFSSFNLPGEASSSIKIDYDELMENQEPNPTNEEPQTPRTKTKWYL